jgi:formamidopyrimidine-DNA glycosylase
MIEIPEAIVISGQIDKAVRGKHIKKTIAAASPHKFAFYFEDPSGYDALLRGRVVERAEPFGGRIEISAEGAALHFGDGVNLRYYEAGEKLPPKHQLLIIFDDDTALVGTIAMYGCLFAFPENAIDDNFYYRVAKEAVPPLSEGFSEEYFRTLFGEQSGKLSAKAFLATEQRIPGLGNGVLQDILLNAKVHPKTKMHSLSDQRRKELFESVKTTLAAMVGGGGRDTERDLFGNFGGYKTKLSKNTLNMPCPECGGIIKKEAYMGGSIYYCENCQGER